MYYDYNLNKQEKSCTYCRHVLLSTEKKVKQLYSLQSYKEFVTQEHTQRRKQTMMNWQPTQNKPKDALATYRKGE